MSPLDPAHKLVGAADDWQRRHRWAGVPYAVQKKFGNDNANLVVLAMAWYGFTAIFPLLLVLTVVFTHIGAHSLGESIIGTLQKFPVIGSSFRPSSDDKLKSSLPGLIVGIIGLVYGAQGVTQSAQQAMATVWNVPQVQRTGFLPRLGRSIAGLITIGGAFLINAIVTTYVSATPSYAIRVPVILGLLIINFGLYFATFYLLTAKVIGPRGLIPGSILGSVAFTALITVGTGLMTHTLKNADNTYGTFGAVIGIVALLLLLSRLSMYAAELNPVLSRRLYPRALPLGGGPTEADHRVLADVVYQQQQRKDQAIGVGFGEGAPEEAARDARRRAGLDPDGPAAASPASRPEPGDDESASNGHRRRGLGLLHRPKHRTTS